MDQRYDMNIHRQFVKAIEELVGAGSIQERLYNAYYSGLVHLDERDFPKDLQEDFRRLGETLTRLPDPEGEGSLKATTDAMDDEEAEECAKEILRIFRELIEPHVR